MRRKMMWALSILLVSAVPALAVPIPLTNTGIDQATLDSLRGTAIRPTLATNYLLSSGGIGQVTSEVYTGAGAAAGLYVYTYQITPSNNPSVVSMSLSFREPLTAAGPYTSFYAPIDLPALVAPSQVVFNTNGGFGSITMSYGGISAGQTGYWVGVFSPHRPQQLDAGVFGAAGGADTTVRVYSAVPEPATVTLLGLGLASLGFGGLLRRYGRRVHGKD